MRAEDTRVFIVFMNGSSKNKRPAVYTTGLALKGEIFLF